MEMFRKKTALIRAIVVAAAVTMLLPITPAAARAPEVLFEASSRSTFLSKYADVQTGCPLIFPDVPVTVAPNQPAVPDQSTVGIINALCDVTLDFIGCAFTPTTITLGCDTNGDGVSDISIPLKNITVIQRLLLQATIPSLTTTPGTAFPLACCGGVTVITLTRTVSAGDDNIFGPFTQTLTCSIDLGVRAPVVISASPADGDCALGQNLLIPGSCFLLADGSANVTSVFGVEAGNPANVIQAGPIHILSSNLIDAFFPANPSNAGKRFLIFASGPSGTSRNLTTLPTGAPAGCPLGNEQGVTVTFRCRSVAGTPSPGTAPSSATVITGCRVDRDESGVFILSIFGKGIREGAILSVGGITPKKIKLKALDPPDNGYTLITAKGKFCDGLPGAIVVTNPDGTSSAPVICAERCVNQ